MSRVTERAEVSHWLAGYETAWRTPGTEDLGRLFTEEYRDLWVIRFAGDGRCAWFEEWPYWPEKPYAESGDPG